MRSRTKFQLAALIVLGCRPDATSPDQHTVRGPSELRAAADIKSAAAGAVTFAKTLAMAASSPTVSMALHAHFRASPLVEHKVVLQDLSRTESGRALLIEVAKETGMGVGDLHGLLAALPPLHMYLPRRDQRLMWDGGPSVSVILLTGSTIEMSRSFRADGEGIPTPVALAGPTNGAAVLITPPEPTARRIGVAAEPPRTSGPVQDRSEAQIGGFVREYLAFGRTRTRDLAEVIGYRDGIYTLECEPNVEECDPPGGGGGIGGGPHTRLKDLVILHVCDFAICEDANEFEWHTYYSSNSGGSWTNRTDVQIVGLTGFEELANIDIPLIAKTAVASNERILTDIIEFDGSWGNDTWFGGAWTPTLLVTAGTFEHLGQPRCGFAVGQHVFTCGFYSWKEINQTLRTTP